MSNCIHSLIAKSSPTPKNPIACIQETCSLSLEDRPLWSLTRTTARPLQTSRETLTSLSWFSCPLKKCPRPSEVSFLLDAVGVVCVRACLCVCVAFAVATASSMRRPVEEDDDLECDFFNRMTLIRFIKHHYYSLMLPLILYEQLFYQDLAQSLNLLFF